MPIPGPRTQHGPLPGYRNPQLQGQYRGAGYPDLHRPVLSFTEERPWRFERWFRPPPVVEIGRTPGVQWVNRRGHRLGPGMVRRFWRQLVGYTPAQAAFSWSTNSPTPDRHILQPGPLGITRALRYMTRSISPRAGEDGTRFSGLHTAVQPQVRSKPVTAHVGNNRNRPTVRNRVSSFGSRVPPLNPPIQASESRPSAGNQ